MTALAVTMIDALGRLLTVCCVCGSTAAPYGFGVDLLRGALGLWACSEHRDIVAKGHNLASRTAPPPARQGTLL
jgi:hypothetical protein